MPDLDPTLEALMGLAHGGALLIARYEELRAPVLTYARPDGTFGILSINLPGVHPADVAKIALAAEQATMAAVCMETWFAEVEPTDEMRADIEAGRIPNLGVRPSQHPNRRDLLLLIGEVKGQPQVQQVWLIDPPDEPGGERRFSQREGWDRAEIQPANFTPLFVELPEIRRLIRTHARLQRLRDQLRQRTN